MQIGIERCKSYEVYLRPKKKIDFPQLRDSEGRREIVLKVKYTILVGTYLMCSNW